MRVDVYSRHDEYLGTIAGNALLSFVHTDELNGEDSVAITTTFPLSEGQRLVWSDAQGKAHEHVCQDPQGDRIDGDPVYSDVALNSICELFGDRIEDRRPYGYSFLRALEVCLEPTRWEPGTVDQPGTVSDGLTFYHTDCRSALNMILGCGGELETEIEVGPSGVSSRKVSIRARRGYQAGHKRFAYGKDLVSVRRTEHWGAITACYGYGKGLETEAGGYGRKLTFGDINGGLDYVGDEEALQAYGRPDGKGGLAHVFGVYENQDCEDAAQLMVETRGYLDEHKVPGVTYEADVVDLVAMGREWEGCGVGDAVQIVDSCFSPTLRCEGRVSRIETDMLAGSRSVTLGNISQTMADLIIGQQGQIDDLNRHSSNWDVAASTPAAYLQQVIDGLNEQFNVSGMSYTYTSFEKGTIYSSVPLDEEGNPTKDGWGMQLCSQGLRIASGTKPDGTFDWRTFGTGEGFTADLITAGTLDAGLIRAGIIQDVTGRNHWNLDTGDLSMMGYAKADQAVSSVAVEYALGDSPTQAPSSGWSQASPQWTAGKYVWQRTKVTGADGTVSYSNTACIQGAKGDKGDPGEDGAPGLPGKDGTDGTSTYTYIKYAPTADPSDAQMTDYPQAYVGLCTSDSPTAPTSASAYAWSRIEGIDGKNGVPGKDGEDGTSVYVHFAYSTTPDGTGSFSTEAFEGAIYIGVRTDTSQPDPTDPAAYAWSLFKGSDGKDGKDGKDGTSVAILGSYGSEEELEQEHPTGSLGDGYIVGGDLYVWDGSGWHNVGTIQGPAGADGQDGAPGKDGLTAYVHRAWANSPDGTQGFSASYFDGAAYMGVYSDHAEADSEDPSDYEWSRFLGQDGAPGTDGTDGVGVSAVVPEWYLSTSKTAPAGGSWSTQEPEWQRGRWIWTRTSVTWTDGTTSYTDPVLAAATNGANEAVDSLDQSLDAQGVFDRLTDHGAIQGIVMEDGSLFVNATYVRTGILSDALGLNSWNLATGELSITGARAWYATCATAAAAKAKAAAVDGEGFALTDGVIVMVRWSNGNSAEGPMLDVGGTGAYPVKIYGSELQGDTVYDWAGGSTSLLYWHDGAWNVCDNASLYRNNSAVREIRSLDTSLDQQGVFDRLTNDGTAKGIYLTGGELYINADYIKAGTVVAEILRGESGMAELSPTNLAGGSIIAMEMSLKESRQSSELAPSWGVMPTYATGDSGALHGFATVSQRRVVDFLVDGPGGRRAIGYDGVEVDPDDPVTVEVRYPRVYLSDGYAGLQAEADRMMYVSDSGVWAYDSAKSRGVYATDSAARLARSSQDYVQAQADGIYLACGGVPAVILPTSGEAFSIRVGGLTLQANTGGMSLAYNNHGFSVEMDGSVHSW